ncbi:neuropeptide Y receptor type 1 isoform X2 [Bacillus rossius redtenbacheri]|uniref:neuropeptide Y receptor type 1 isoform X2 n=1 Tax=Bacillus rossius redtenbacheri TaxID=93214 RepID=UPI002FDD86E6
MCISRAPWRGLARICADAEGRLAMLQDGGAGHRIPCNGSADVSQLGRELDDRNGYHVVVKSAVERPAWEIAAKSLAVVPLVICGVLFNVMLLSVVCKTRQLHTPSNLLIANMAVADIATLLLCPWMLLCADLFQNYVLGEFGCKSHGFFECFLLLTGVLNLVVISYDRLMAVVQPLEARLTVRATCYIMAATWLTGVALGAPLVFYRNYLERKWLNFFETYCSENPSIYMYWYIVITLIIWMPLSVMTVCYIAIFVELERYEQRFQRRGEQAACLGQKTRVARIMFAVVVVFIVCRVPFTALVIRRTEILRSANMDTVDSTFQILWFTSKYLMLANSAVNPVIYGMTNRNLQRGFAKLPLSRWLLRPASQATAGFSPQPPGAQQQQQQQRRGAAGTPRLLREDGAPKCWFVAPQRRDAKPLPTECLYI